MVESQRKTVIQKDTIIKGEIRNCSQIEIHGYVEGQLGAETILVHDGGTLYGTVKTNSADILGTVQGEVFVRNLINIRSSGTVNGNVQYGQLAMEMGANLSAHVSNVPPRIAGDLDLTVTKGGSVAITTEDLTAIDPDDVASDLVYSIARAEGGHLAFAGARSKEIAAFTQADIENSKVLFVHDGEAAAANFDISVTDASGASSGMAQTVKVNVKGGT